MTVVVALVWAFLAGGLIPLASLWRFEATSRSRLLLGGMTASYLWCLSSAVSPLTLGPHYSDIRLNLIQGNLLVAFAMAIVGVKIFRRKGLAWAAGIWLPSIWIYVRTVSFVV